MSKSNKNSSQYQPTSSSTNPPKLPASAPVVFDPNKLVREYDQRLATLEKGMEGIEKNIEKDMEVIEQDIKTHTSDLKVHYDKISKLEAKSNTKPFHESSWFNVIITVTLAVLGGLIGVLLYFNTCIQDLQGKVIVLEQQRPTISSQVQPKK